jgi:hypothetical protein
MKKLSWKYLAGLIDGEGCIDIVVNKREEQYYIQPRVRITMTVVAEALMDNICNNFAGSREYRTTNNPKWQDSITWNASGYNRACTFLRNIVNHLIVKKEQARFALWLESNLKGRKLTAEAVTAVKNEMKLMKRDPHRLSEQAQEAILAIL